MIDEKDFLTDEQRDHECARLNTIPALFNHKLITHAMLAQHDLAQPELVAFVWEFGIIANPGRRPQLISHAQLTERLVNDGGPFIWKPECGKEGRQVARLEVTDGSVVITSEAGTRPFSARCGRCESFVIERRVEPHSFWNALSPSAVPTLRVLTQWTPGDAEPFIARIMQRFATRASAPTDNWSAGGLMARVDIETGVMSAARRKPQGWHDEARRAALTAHPDTGVQIEGVVLPFMDRIRATALLGAACLPHQPYIGWDIAIDVDGNPVIIEANSNVGLESLQQHGGLLADPPVRRFYEKSGVLDS